MAADIDVRAISSFSSLPETTVTSLLDAPTVDAVKLLLKGVEASLKTFEQSKSQKVKLEVELETVVRTSESKAKVLQTHRDKALAEASRLRIDLQTSENTRSRLESELDQFRNATTAEATETTNLKSRVSSLEAANRDTLALLESKTSSYDKLSQDLSAQHQKAVDLRKQISTLEQSVQVANSSGASAKFREQSLQQEVDLLKKNNEWLENERQIKADEHTHFRKEKNGRIAELSRSNEHYISETESLKRSETSLKHRIEEQASKYEESLQEVQKLREEKIAEADGFRVELESVNRLAELQKASADTAKSRVQELFDALEETKEEASDEIGRIRAEAESEHNDRLTAEQKITELESRIIQLQAEVAQAQDRPSTPQRPINGTGVSTPVRPGTPVGIFSPSTTSRLKGNLSTTQLYTEYKKLEKDLASEKRTNEQLQTNLDAMLEDLEASRPEIDELRSDHSRIQRELLEMSSLVERANGERDRSLKEARACQGQLEGKSKEIGVLAQQLRDAGSEIRYLLMEQYVREQGDSLSQEDFQQLQREADEAMQQETSNLSDTQQLVNQQLIVFKSITELQQQNENQLKTIRNLVKNLESDESQERYQLHATTAQELEVAKAQIASYQDEIRTMVTQSKSFVKERDMFRNMLTRRGHLADPTDFSRSLPIPVGGSPARGNDGSSPTGVDSDIAKLLKDLQQQYDSYRQEAATDLSSLKAQVDDLTKRNSQLQTDASRAVGQLSAATGRWEMLQENFNMLKTENSEIQKRSFAAMENATKQEMKTQQAAEDLVEARGMLDSLRRESANLKAEKDLWKNVEKRLVDDNETLRNERGRLDQLNGSLQNILNEREQADTETRRRLQAQVETLEIELQSTKRKLNEETDENKKATLRKEYEHEQSQKRIDDLVTSLGAVREDMAGAKSSRDHLQLRVDELTVELRSAEERIELLTRPAAEPVTGSNGVEESAMSREQELGVEVSELRRDLELKTAELDRANEQVEVYQNISQSSEERLQQLIETNDQYREETDTAVAEKTAKIEDLEQRIEDISSELSTTNSELSQLRDEQSESNRKLDEQKASFEGDIERLKSLEEKSAEQARFNLEASKVQAQIATEAQQNYETELLKHAEAAKTLQAVRSEANQLRLDVVDLRTKADTAETDLQQKQASWMEMKDRYEHELNDIKTRREEVLQQNTLLHGQLENVTQQITALQRDRATLADDETSDTPGGGLDNLQEVIKYLRREKEIVDVQYHLSTQDAKRLRQQLDFSQAQLDETRLKLDQQHRAEADSERHLISHNKLMETLAELNLFRESSVTLRAEAKQATQALANKTERVAALETQVQQVQARVAELENLTELREGEMKLLQDDRDHWQQRTQNILSKYDRVDPAEIEALREKITTLEAERDDLVASRGDLQAQVDGMSEQVESAKSDLRNRLQEQFKSKVKELNGKIKEKQTEADNALAEQARIQSELDFVREELESARNQQHRDHPQLANGEVASSQGAAVDGANDQSGELRSDIAELKTSLEEKDQELATLKSEQDSKFKAREAEMKNVLNKRLTEVKQELQIAKETALKELREKLASEHQQELESMQTRALPGVTEVPNPASSENNAEPTPTPSTEISDAALEHLSEAQARLLVQKNEIVRGILKINIRKAAEKEREAARKEFAESQATTGDTVSSEQVQELEQRLAAETEVLINQKEAEFASEKDALIKEHADSLAKEKQELIIKHQEELSSQKLEFSKEAERKIAQQVASAEQMWEKKNIFKLNMAQRQAGMAQAKLDIVKTAADETPEKAVSEVWAVAKDAKPPVAAPAAKPTPPAAGSAAAQPAPATATAPTATPASIKPEASTGEESTAEAPQPAIPNGPTKPPSTNVGTGPGALRQLASGLPRGGTSIRGRGAGNTAQGGHPPPSGLPQAAGRGTGIPRGSGRGRGTGDRGGARSLSTNVAQQPSATTRGGAAQSPSSRGSLNPGAQQFTPGAKRAREDAEGGDAAAGNLGKRIRGGGAGS